MKTPLFLSLLVAITILIIPSVSVSRCVQGECNNGSGVWKYKDGAKYKGSFRNGNFDGYGTFNFTDGRSYEGEWKYGLLNGYGKFCYFDNTCLVGHFKDGKLSGFGKYVYPDGREDEGLWKNGDFHEETTKNVWYRVQYSKEDIRHQVNELGATLPMVIDSATTITSVILLDEYTINFRYLINKTAYYRLLADSKKQSIGSFKSEKVQEYGNLDQYFEHILSRLAENNTKRNCSNPSTRELIDGGVTFKHTYYDLNRNYLDYVAVNKDICYSL